VVNWVSAKQEYCRKAKGTAFIWLSDEFYLQAGLEVPPSEIYEDFPQLENGVGMVRLFWQEFSELELPRQLPKAKEIYVATGVSGRYALEPIIRRLQEIQGLEIKLQVIPNIFFGPSVTVTGLLTGRCLEEGLKTLPPGSTVIIPGVLLEMQEGKFLDDLTPEIIAERRNVRLIVSPVEAKEFVAAVLAD
jgi:NifB/MoaA-like Fe-S oxidoreductase